MKTVVGLLIVANLVLFYWIYQQPGQGNALESELATNMPPLQLLSEMPPAEPEVLNQPVTIAEPVEETLEEVTAAEPVDETLKEVSEESPEAPELVETVIPRAVFLELSCYSLGPFPLEKGVESATSVLTELGLVTVKRFETRRELSGFWVYIPPLPDRAAARKVVSMLKKRGVKDYLIVPRGVKKNAISLGFFRTRDGAQQHQAHMQALGLAPVLDDSYRESSGFWLDFTSPNTPPLPEAIVEALQTQYDGISMKKRQCLE